MSNQDLVVKEVNDKKGLREFVRFPFLIHEGHENWVPPIIMDDMSFFDPRKNSSFRYCDHIRLIAYRSGKPVGRIMGLINHKYNNRKNENNARFSYLETFEDQEVVSVLINRVQDWARSLGAEKIVGPLGFSDKEPQGYLIEGFNEPVLIATLCNMPYQAGLLEKEGYSKEIDLVSFKTPLTEELPAVYKRILPRLEKFNEEFKVMEFRSRLQLRKYIRPVLRLTNEAFKDIYASMPYEEAEMDEFANRFILFLNPHFVKAILDQNDEVIAYVVGMSDISNGIRKAKGRVLPFGIFTMLRSGRKSKQLNLMLGAVDERYRGRGLDVLLALKLFKSGRDRGKEVMDSHMVWESNTKMLAEYDRIGGEVYKRFRIYQKNL